MPESEVRWATTPQAPAPQTLSTSYTRQIQAQETASRKPATPPR